MAVSRNAPKTDRGGREAWLRVTSGTPSRCLPDSGTSGRELHFDFLTLGLRSAVCGLLSAVMSVLAPLLLRGLTGPARRLLVPRAQIHSKPPREQLGTMVRSGSDRGFRGGFGAAGSGAPGCAAWECPALGDPQHSGVAVLVLAWWKGQCPGQSRSVSPGISGHPLSVPVLLLSRCASSSKPSLTPFTHPFIRGA